MGVDSGVSDEAVICFGCWSSTAEARGGEHVSHPQIFSAALVNSVEMNGWSFPLSKNCAGASVALSMF